MNNIETLIRLHRWRLDEKGRNVRELEDLAGQLRGQLTQLAAELTDEQKVASTSNQAHGSYAAYGQRNMEQRRNLSQSLQNVEHEIEAAREDLAQAFRELKRYEIVQDDRAKHQRVRTLRAEQMVLDNISLDLHRRRSEAT